MNLYLISQNEYNGYDTYDSAVVCAESPEKAALVHPAESWGVHNSSYYWENFQDVWCSSPDQVQVKFLGVADSQIEEGIVLASFHAG